MTPNRRLFSLYGGEIREVTDDFVNSSVVRRSNGKRLIELRRAESDDTQGATTVDPVDPVGALCGDLREISGHGEKTPAT